MYVFFLTHSFLEILACIFPLFLFRTERNAELFKKQLNKFALKNPRLLLSCGKSPSIGVSA
jgi:hypothetical protein